MRMGTARPGADAGDVDRILANVRFGGRRATPPALAVLVGLPGSGKSRVAGALRDRTDAVVLESDALRRLLVQRPSYSSAESRRLFAAIHTAIERLLADGRSLVLDATNLVEAERVPLYKLAADQRARLILVRVSTPDAVVRSRLARREMGEETSLEAGTEIYERMLASAEEIQRPHYTVDTSQDMEAVLAAIAKEILGRG